MNTLHSENNGPADAPVILFLHGFLGSGADWAPIVQTLNTFRCLTIDFPGHGKSINLNNITYQFEQTVTHIAEIVKQQKGRPPHVVGYSMGGRIALGIACQYPDVISSLTLLSASPGLATEQERAERRNSDARIADRLETENTEQFLRDWYAQPLFTALAANKPLLERTIVERLKHNPHEWAKSQRGAGNGMQPSYWEQLHTIAIPTLLLTGERDSKFIAIADMMKQKNRRFQAEIISNAGHALHIEQPLAVAEQIQSFIANTEKG